MQKLLSLLLTLFLFAGAVSAQQTQTLPQKVEVKPRSDDRADDSLRVWGGICAGGDPCTVIVDTTGVLSVAAAIADGSIDFDKFKDEGCADNEVIGWDEDTTSYVCMTVSTLGGLTATGGPYTITGAWTFTPASVGGVVFGNTISPAQLIHIYNSAGSGGLRIQGNGGAWDLLSATNFTIGDTDIGTALTIYNTTNNVETSANLTVGGTLSVTGVVAALSTISDDLVPTTGNGYDLGSYVADRRWRDLYVSNIDAAVFRVSTITTVGGQLWVVPDTGITGNDIDATQTTIDLGVATLPATVSLPATLLIKGRSTAGTYNTEYIRVESLNSGTTWNVCRDQADGTGGCGNTGYAWSAGQPWVLLGNEGHGRLELNTNTNKPQIALVKQGSAYNTSTVFGAFGSLTGVSMGSMGTGNKIGLAIGSTTNYLKYQTPDVGGTTGETDDDKLIVQGTVRATAGWFGTSATAGVRVDADGLTLLGTNTGRISGGKTTLADNTGGFWLGTDGSSGWDFKVGDADDYLHWDDSLNTLTIRGVLNADDLTAGTIAAGRITAASIEAGDIVSGDIDAITITGSTLQTAASCGTANTTCTKMDSTGILWYGQGVGAPYLGVSATSTRHAYNLYGTSNTFLTIGTSSVGMSGLTFAATHGYGSLVPGVAAAGITWPGANASRMTGIVATEEGALLVQGAGGSGTNLTLRGAKDSAVSHDSTITLQGGTGGDITITPYDDINLDGHTLVNATLWIGYNQTADPGYPWISSTDGENLAINSSANPLYINNNSAQPIYHYGDGYTYLHKFGGPNIIQWRDTSGAAAPAFTTRSAGTRMVLYPEISGSSVDYGFGIESNTMWASVPTTSKTFTWYGGTTSLMSLQNSGGSNAELLLRGRSGISANGTYGVILTLQRSTGTANTPGMILWNSADNAFNFMWVDDSDQLRIGAAPEGDGSPANTDGTVVGTQTSQLEIKNILAEQEASTGDALELVLKTRVFDFTYKNGSYNGETFTGIVTNYSPWFGMDGGRVLNNVNALGLMVLSVQNLQQQIVELEAELNDLKVKVKDKKDPKPATDISKKTKPDKTIPPIPIAPPPPVVVGGV